MKIDEFLEKSGLPHNDETVDKLEKLTDLILEWNQKINVTAIRERDAFIDKNVIDSLKLGLLKEFRESDTVLDMGTGGGFPGLPLAVVFPEKKFVLADAIAKKLKVVADTAEKLGLQNVSVVHARAEDLGKNNKYRESFLLVTSRAVANMSTLSEYCIPFVKQGGYFLAFKTENAAEEVGAAANAISKLGGSLVRIDQDIDGDTGHTFVVIKKTGKTPAEYPRKAGTPSDKPL